jgi:hypothetical protein
MAAQVIAAIAGAVIGGITQGVTTAITTNEKVKALQQAANQAREMANKYSGAELNRKMTEAGQANAQNLNQSDLANQLNQMTNTSGAAMANANNNPSFQNNYAGYYKQGADRESAMNAAQYGKEQADIERNLKQADINYNVANQTAQAGLNAVGGVAGGIADMGGFGNNSNPSRTQTQYNASRDLSKVVPNNPTGTFRPGSDENLKEPVNNDSGLTHADIQDSLRQLESVKYKYTDEAQQTNPNSTDNDTHVGSVTQSYEKTPLFERAVVKDENGMGHMDLYKLNEALAAGLAEMQREIDSLGAAPTSDDRCKTIETAIESNPEQAAKQLPQGTPIQQEAVQATQNGPQAEVNNKVVDEYTNLLKDHFGDKFAAYTPNDYMKQIPKDATFDSLPSTDWFKNKRNEYKDKPRWENKDGFIYSNQPGFDINEEWIKANDPGAYKDYGFNRNYTPSDYDKWGQYRDDNIRRDAEDFVEWMDNHPEYTSTEVLDAFADKYKKYLGKDFPREDFWKHYTDEYDRYYLDKYDKQLYKEVEDALGNDDVLYDEDWAKIKDDVLEYIKQTGKVPGYMPYDASQDTYITNALIDRLMEEFPEIKHAVSTRVDLGPAIAKALGAEEPQQSQQEADKVDPVTAKMNEGLSEDDPDYFGSDERIKKPIAKTGRRINA